MWFELVMEGAGVCLLKQPCRGREEVPSGLFWLLDQSSSLFSPREGPLIADLPKEPEPVTLAPRQLTK